MDWIQSIQKTIDYIECNVLEDMSIDDIACRLNYSKDYLKKMFSMATGISISEYIKSRKLSLAAQELCSGEKNILDIALKYGYKTHEGFTKAFFRYHKINPSECRNNVNSIYYMYPLSIQINIKGGNNMSRKIIPNIPLITLHGNNYSYLTSFIGAAYAVLKGLGEDYEYDELLSVSGAGNRLCWTEDKWVFGNELISNIEEVPFEIPKRLFDAFGKDYKIYSINDKNPALPECIKTSIIKSIDNGIPVIIQGLLIDVNFENATGNPDDYGVFYGYENEGEKLVGWNYYQKDENAYIVENWLDKVKSVIILTAKKEPMSERERAITAFKTIVDYSYKNEINGKKVGFSAFESLLNNLEYDDFSKCKLNSGGKPTPPNTSADNLEHRLIIYCDALCQINERGSTYFNNLISKFPEWKNELSIAIDSWNKCASYGSYLWSLGLSFNDKGFELFRNKQNRKKLADEGRKSMEHDINAVEHIKIILRKEGYTY